MKKITTFLLLVLFVAGGIYAQTVEELIEQGDQFYTEHNNRKALEVFEKANKEFPKNWEITWRLSRTYVDIAEHMPNESGEEEDLQYATYEKALKYSEEAVKLEPNKSLSYLRRAIANGKIALFKGVFSVTDIVNQVRDDAEKAIKLNNGSDFDQAVAHYVLARTHGKISEKWAPARALIGLSWADNEVALKEYANALKRDDKFMMIYHDYAISLIREDEYEKAREMLNKALACPDRDEDDASRRGDIKKLLKEIEDE